MPHTGQQAQEIKDQFAVRKKRQWLATLVFIPLFILLAMSGKGRAEVIAPVFAVAVLAALIFSFWNWRCPSCNAYLGKGMGPSFCPKCGTALR